MRKAFCLLHLHLATGLGTTANSNIRQQQQLRRNLQSDPCAGLKNNQCDPPTCQWTGGDGCVPAATPPPTPPATPSPTSGPTGEPTPSPTGSPTVAPTGSPIEGAGYCSDDGVTACFAVADCECGSVAGSDGAFSMMGSSGDAAKAEPSDDSQTHHYGEVAMTARPNGSVPDDNDTPVTETSEDGRGVGGTLFDRRLRGRDVDSFLDYDYEDYYQDEGDEAVERDPRHFRRNFRSAAPLSRRGRRTLQSDPCAGLKNNQCDPPTCQWAGGEGCVPATTPPPTPPPVTPSPTSEPTGEVSCFFILHEKICFVRRMG